MTPAIDDIMQQKLNKLNALRASGVEPFPYGYHRTHTTHEAVELLQQSPFNRESFALIIEGLGSILKYVRSLNLDYRSLINPQNIDDVKDHKAFYEKIAGLTQQDFDLLKQTDASYQSQQIEILKSICDPESTAYKTVRNAIVDYSYFLKEFYYRLEQVFTFEDTHAKASIDDIIAFLVKIANPALEDVTKYTGIPVKVNVAGRIMSKRGMGKTCFMDLRDSSGKIQLFFRINNLEAKYDQVKDLDIGDIVGAQGKLFLTRTNEPTIEVRDFTLLAKALQPLPEKWHGLVDTEKRYRQRYLDLISNPEAKKTFVIRSKTITAIRDFLNKRGFLEVETPVLQPEAGGASAKPFTTHYNALDRDFYLRIALELHLKRLIIGGFDKVYEMGHVFRNEGIDIKHNPEFTMLETYEAYADYQDVMKMVEDMISSVCQQVLGTMKVEYNSQTIDFTPPWKRLNMHEAVLQYAELDYDQYPDTASLKAEMLRRGMQFDTNRERGKLIDELVSTYVDPNLIQPTFLCDHPIELSPLAKKKPGNDRVVERFEPYAAGMELGNAFTELNDPIDQRERFMAQAAEKARGDEEAQGVDEDFLTAMEHGMPPTGGLGIGVDRLVMILTNNNSIREVILFPALKEKE